MTPQADRAIVDGWRSSWVFATVLFAIASLVESLGFGHLGAFTPLYLRELGMPAEDIPRWTGYLAASAFVIGLPLAPFWGIWADKYSRKMIIVRSAFGEAVIFVIAALATNVWHLLIARMIVGLILGNTGVMYAFISTVAPKRNWSLAIGIVSVGSTIGMSIGPMLGGQVVTAWGIRPLLAIDAGLSAVVGLAIAIALKEPAALRRAMGSSVEMLASLFRSVVGMPVILILFGTDAVLLLGLQISSPFIPILVEQLYQGNDLPTAIGIISGSFAIALAVSTPIWGRLGDLGGHRRMLMIATAFTIPSLAVQAFVGNLTQLFYARIAQGAFQAAMGPLLMTLIANHAPEERRASILNLSLFPNYFAWIVGSVAGSAIASTSIAMLFLAGAAVLAAGLILLARFTPGDDLASGRAL